MMDVTVTLFLTGLFNLCIGICTVGDADALGLLLLFNVRPPVPKPNNNQRTDQAMARQYAERRSIWTGAYLFWERACTCAPLMCAPKQKWRVRRLSHCLHRYPHSTPNQYARCRRRRRNTNRTKVFSKDCTVVTLMLKLSEVVSSSCLFFFCKL